MNISFTEEKRMLKSLGIIAIAGITDVSGKYREILEKNILETNDKVGWGILANLETTQNYLYYDHYVRIFGLCRLLGLTDLYDIGCGEMYQAFLLINFPGMVYTGIDAAFTFGHSKAIDRDNKRFDFTYINDLIMKCGDDNKIKYQIAEYPFAIMPAENNVAILSGCLGATMSKDDESIKNTAAALTRDFERVIMGPFNDFEKWEAELKDFKFHTIREDDRYSHHYMLGTKFQKDISILEETGYNYYDDRFTLHNVDNIDVTR